MVQATKAYRHACGAITARLLRNRIICGRSHQPSLTGGHRGTPSPSCFQIATGRSQFKYVECLRTLATDKGSTAAPRDARWVSTTTVEIVPQRWGAARWGIDISYGAAVSRRHKGRSIIGSAASSPTTQGSDQIDHARTEQMANHDRSGSQQGNPLVHRRPRCEMVRWSRGGG